MLTYDISARGKTPLYDYIYQCIRRDIIEGKLSSGERLPSKRQLAEHLHVGVITVTNAYAQLVTEGYVTSEEKRGYFVADVKRYRQPVTNRIPKTKNKVEPDTDIIADFRMNRPRRKLFPVAMWNKLMRETLSEGGDALWRTVPWNGLAELREALSQYLRENRGIEATSEQIVIGAGTEYLYGRLMQLFGRATTFAIEDPGYKKFGVISESYGAPWKYVPIDSAGLKIDALEESGADVVHLSPANHFPTGIVMPITRRLDLFEWVNRVKKRYIIEDDYDSEFRYTGKFILPLYAEDTQGKVIYLNTFSKSIAPSLRISYMVLPEPLLRRYRETQSFYSSTVSSFEQATLARFIARGFFERHLARLKKYYREQRAAMLHALKCSPLITSGRAVIMERRAGTHFLLHVDTELSRSAIEERAKERGIALSFYADYFHAPLNEEGVTLVINYAAIARDAIEDVVSRLCDVFE